MILPGRASTSGPRPRSILYRKTIKNIFGNFLWRPEKIMVSSLHQQWRRYFDKKKNVSFKML